MTTKSLIAATAITALAGASAWWAAPTVAADGRTAMVAWTASTMTVDDDKYEYLGDSKCKMCHIKEHRSWSKTKMGKAFETLKPGVKAEEKKAHGLDPDKDYSTDESCLPCHTQGYGHKGGYAVPDPNDKAAVKAASKLEGVGCESCHGPGSAYIEIFQDIMKSKRKYKVEELHAAGLTKINESTCTECHNDKSPTFDSEKGFNFEEMKAKREEIHELVELKQREG